MERNAADFSESGVFNVNGQWATAIRFSADFDEGQMTRVALRFSNGRSEIASATLDAAAARNLLGERNFAAIAKVGAKVGSAPAQGVGELRGKTLAYRQVALQGHDRPGPNMIEVDERVRQSKPAESRDGTAQEEAPSPAPASLVPVWVRERFLVVDDRYYFPDRTLAFTDGGNRLKSETHNPEAVRALIAIAELRGWASVKVSGSVEFRRETWRIATAQGIGVKGYEPSDVEREDLLRAMHRPQGRAQADSESAAAPRLSDREARPADDRVEPKPPMLTGTLIESGAAPYRFDRSQGLSYFVKLATAHGERTLWGVDLERALVESATRVKEGDEVGVENLGSRPVTVKSLQRDADGKVTDARIAAHRNRWLIEKPGYFEERVERAEAFRNGQAARRELEQRYPDLTGAIVSLWLGEQFADRMIERPEDRERVVALVKERIGEALERGEAVDAPRLKQEVQQRLQAIGDDLGEMGQRARARAATRRTKDVRELARDVPPQVLA